ncbi:hypothetical protein [Streptomyces sp. NPDC003077]|uniref:hypothetical protein n=1 Tax=Streptomyces sp. NPDC003077 TaxID=3154443 RepID=UPI0033B5D34E
MFIEQAQRPVFALLGNTLLSTPDVTDNPALTELWTASLATAAAAYVLFVLVGGVLVMGHETIQTRYRLKQIAPRLVIGIVAAISSLTVLDQAITLANAVSQAVLGNTTISGKGVAQQLLGQLLLPGKGTLYGLILGLIMLALVFGVLIGYTVRITLIAVLTACAPLALSCHALPLTDGIARLWWRATAGCLVIQLAQSTVFVVGLKLYFAPDNFLWGIPNPSQLSNLLAGLCLFWVLVKIPGWSARVIFRSTPVSMPGTPLPLRLLRSVALAYIMRGVFRGTTPTRNPFVRPGRGSTPPGPGQSPGPPPPPGRPGGPVGATPPGPGTPPPPPSPAAPPSPPGTGGVPPPPGGTAVHSPSPGPSGSSPSHRVPRSPASRNGQQLPPVTSRTPPPGQPGHPAQTPLTGDADRPSRGSSTPAPATAPRPPGGRQTVLPIRVERVRFRPSRPVQLRLPLENPTPPAPRTRRR